MCCYLRPDFVITPGFIFLTGRFAPVTTCPEDAIRRGNPSQDTDQVDNLQSFQFHKDMPMTYIVIKTMILINICGGGCGDDDYGFEHPAACAQAPLWT